MNINWNPMYSPVWGWLKNHGLAVLGVVVAKPELFGLAAPMAAKIGGLMTVVGALAQSYTPDAPASK